MEMKCHLTDFKFDSFLVDVHAVEVFYAYTKAYSWSPHTHRRLSKSLNKQSWWTSDNFTSIRKEQYGHGDIISYCALNFIACSYPLTFLGATTATSEIKISWGELVPSLKFIAILNSLTLSGRNSLAILKTHSC